MVSYSSCFLHLLSLCFASVFHTILTDCPLPDEKFENGIMLYESKEDVNMTTAPELYLLRFSCENGFERSGPKIIVCSGGKWSHSFPQCTSMSCDLPTPVLNGAYEVEKGLVIGSVAVYYCDPGFELENETHSTLTCVLRNNSAQWSGRPPVCIEKSTCPDPGVSPQGYREGDCCFKGDIVEYSCRSGYQLVGRRRIACLPGGLWSRRRPRCRPSTGHCPDPPAIGNGTVKALFSKADYVLPYEEVQVVCDPGFAYFGFSEYVMCTAKYEWDVEFGECVETFCLRPEEPENGKILELQSNNQTDFPHKSEITYVCDEGFRLFGETYRSCDGGNWTGEEPSCGAIKCPNPKHLENGFVVVHNFSIGQKAVFTCKLGYELIGSPERFCLPNGQWSGQLTSCSRKSNFCPDPGVPINGRKVGHRYNEGDEVQFRCYPGYSLIGSRTRTCLSTGEWSGEEARCLGTYDFDNAANVGEKLKTIIKEKAEDQAAELNKSESIYRAASFVIINGTLQRRVQMKRILNLTQTERLIFYFLFDVSGSVKKENFDTSIKFAKSLVLKVGITEMGARAGALTFSSKADIIFNPVQYSTTEDVLRALDNIEYTKGGTATSSALRLIRREAIPLTRERLGRKGLKHVVFILTDGRANTGGSPEEEAKKLKASKVEIYCIGITGDIMKNSLYKIASEPTEEHVFILNNYKTLEWLIQEITNGTLDYSKCGLGLEKVGKSDNRLRIVSGKKVDEPWPWMAALYITDTGPSELELKCGGSIVGPRWILTAAHCLCEEDKAVPRRADQVVVKLGLTDVKNFTHLQEYEAERFFIHENYNPQNYDYDVGLILLKGVITYTAYVRPICLPPQVIPDTSLLYKAQESAFAAGWGHTQVMKKGQRVGVKALQNLKELFLPLQSRQKCRDSLLKQEFESHLFTSRMLCAGTGVGSGDTCVGDSGGPLMQSQVNKDGIVFWTQVGIVSWGIGCNLVDTYGYYTHVQRLLPFLTDVMERREGV